MQTITTFFNKIVSSINAFTNGEVNANQTATSENVFASVMAEFQTAQQETLLYQVGEQFIHSATQDNSIINLTATHGINRKAGTYASGSVVIQGNVNTIIPQGTSFINSSGILYQTNADATITSNSFSISSLSRVSNVVTVTTATNHNLATNTILSISGILNDVSLNASSVAITVINNTQFTFSSIGSDIIATGSIIGSGIYTIVNITALSAGSTGNLISGSGVSLTASMFGLNTLAYVNYSGLTGGSDMESIASLKARGIEAMQVFASNLLGDNFSVKKLQVLLKQNTDCTRVWVYQASSDSEAGYITTVSVNDNQSPVTLNASQLSGQFTYMSSILSAFLPVSRISALTANLVSIDITITGLTPATTSMYIAIKNELINYFQTNSVIKRVLNASAFTALDMAVAVKNTVDTTTNLSPLFNQTNFIVSGLSNVINDNDLSVLGTLSINGTII